MGLRSAAASRRAAAILRSSGAGEQAHRSPERGERGGWRSQQRTPRSPPPLLLLLLPALAGGVEGWCGRPRRRERKSKRPRAPARRARGGGRGQELVLRSERSSRREQLCADPERRRLLCRGPVARAQTAIDAVGAAGAARHRGHKPRPGWQAAPRRLSAAAPGAVGARAALPARPCCRRQRYE